MAQITARIATLDPACETVLICHHGVRCQRVTLDPEARGHQPLVNPEGGIDAWAHTVGPPVPGDGGQHGEQAGFVQV